MATLATPGSGFFSYNHALYVDQLVSKSRAISTGPTSSFFCALSRYLRWFIALALRAGTTGLTAPHWTAARCQICKNPSLIASLCLQRAAIHRLDRFDIQGVPRPPGRCNSKQKGAVALHAAKASKEAIAVESDLVVLMVCHRVATEKNFVVGLKVRNNFVPESLSSGRKVVRMISVVDI